MADSTIGTDPDQLSLVSGRLALVIGRLNRRMLRATEGLSHSGLSALSSVVKFGPLRLNELAQREGVAAATITRIAVDLGERGFVTRTADKRDRRATTIEATTAGMDYILKARSARADVMNALLASLDDHDRELVEQALPVLEALVLEAQFGDRA
ncbi:MAG: transcriptional regulator, MarR family [Microbacteriaceae bacterium]|nr:transcriptional regulator, MarR family [Microbacteriaceae bacterium]